MLRRLLLPQGAHVGAWPLLQARALRAFADGLVAVLLPAYLLALGLGTWEVGLLATTTLLGSALATLAVGAWGHRVHPRHRLLSGAAALMAATGVAFAIGSSFWPLMAVAFIGTLNPSSGDASVFLPLEHARLAEAAEGDARTELFARYSLLGSLGAALGALAAVLPGWISASTGSPVLLALRGMFLLYGAVGAMVWWLYRDRAPSPRDAPSFSAPPRALGPSRPAVLRLAVLFAIDSLAGGLVVHALLVVWLFQRFGMSLAAAGTFLFATGLCSAASQWVAPWLARRIGLVNTMVWTHLPASVCLIAAAFTPNLGVTLGLLALRALLSQMDVPARSAFVMSVVTPSERAAAASFTAVPRSLAAASGPTLGGALLSLGWLAAPLVVCGILKIAYDLALWRAFRRHSPAATKDGP